MSLRRQVGNRPTIMESSTFQPICRVYLTSRITSNPVSPDLGDWVSRVLDHHIELEVQLLWPMTRRRRGLVLRLEEKGLCGGAGHLARRHWNRAVALVRLADNRALCPFSPYFGAVPPNTQADSVNKVASDQEQSGGRVGTLSSPERYDCVAGKDQSSA